MRFLVARGLVYIMKAICQAVFRKILSKFKN